MSTISLHLLPEPDGASPVAQTALHTYLSYPTSSLSSSLLPTKQLPPPHLIYSRGNLPGSLRPQDLCIPIPGPLPHPLTLEVSAQVSCPQEPYQPPPSQVTITWPS